MDGLKTSFALRGVRLFALAALAATPAAAEAPVPADPFAQQFAAFGALPDAPDPITNPGLDAVDLDHFEPEIEEPAERIFGEGRASYYGAKFHGRRTASGQTFDMHAMTAAHPTLPFGSRVRVTNERTGKSVIVRINDRGPFVKSRIIDVSRAAAEQLGMVRSGHANVTLALLD